MKLKFDSKYISTSLMVLGAVVLGVSFFKEKPSELHNNTAKELIQTVRSPKAAAPAETSVESLRKAFTGKWFKNEPVAATQEAGSFDFNAPQNTRNTLEAKKEETRKKLAEKKKKDARKKKLQAFKAYRQKRNSGKKGPSLFDFKYDDKGIPEFVYYPYNQNPAQNTPANAGETTKQWTIEELFTSIQSTQNISQLIQLYRSGQITAQIFYGTIDKLFTTQVAKNHEFGFSALSQTPSIASFASHVSYLADETTESVRTTATSQLETYKLITNLPILNTALNNNEREVQSTSAEFLQQVADFLLQSAQVQPVTGDERAPSSLTPAILERYRVILRQSSNILATRLSTGNLDAELTAQYTQSRARIEQFLASQNNAVTASFQY